MYIKITTLEGTIKEFLSLGFFFLEVIQEMLKQKYLDKIHLVVDFLLYALKPKFLIIATSNLHEFELCVLHK